MLKHGLEVFCIAGDNVQEPNTMTIDIFLFLLAEVIGCKLEDVLIFFTGADCVPLLGFDHEPKVWFLHD